MTGLDLTTEEQGRVRLAMRYLRIRAGGWKSLAPALGFEPRQMEKICSGEKAVSPKMVLRVARLAGVPVDDLLTGKFPSPGACPHCGHVRDK
jgi:hypothetical protein